MIAIAALDLANGIGRNGQLLKPISADLKRFKRITMGKILIYGRKTLDTFPGKKILPGRKNFILSQSLSTEEVPGAQIFPSLEALLSECEALKRRDAYKDQDFCVIGGASIYRQLLPYCHELDITRIQEVYEADAFFPDPALHGFLMDSVSEELSEDQIIFHHEHWIRITEG